MVLPQIYEFTDLRSRNFYSITIYFISSNLLQLRVICVKVFNEAKTAENLEKILFKSLSDFEMPLEHKWIIVFCLIIVWQIN